MTPKTPHIPPVGSYTAIAKSVVAINPKHQRAVIKFCEAHRRVDFHVDSASRASDLEQERIHQKHLKLEDRWFDRACEIESELPRREVENAAKHLLKVAEGESNTYAAVAYETLAGDQS